MKPESRSEAAAPSRSRDGVETADRRQSERRAVQTELVLRVSSGAIAGITENLSQIGVLFFSEDPLQVEVEVSEGEGEGSRTYSGRLVRMQPMSGKSTGFAVEFDRE